MRLHGDAGWSASLMLVHVQVLWWRSSFYPLVVSTAISTISKWASSWENVSSGVSDQVRLKLACSPTEPSMRLEILVTETRDITLSRQWTTKALIRLCRCTSWSAPLLFAYDIRHIFSWPGSNKNNLQQRKIYKNSGQNCKIKIL